MGEKEEIFNLKVATLYISLIRTTYLQESRTREERLRAEERSKGMAGTRYENNRRSLEQSLKSKQEALLSKHRQGDSCSAPTIVMFHSRSCYILIISQFCSETGTFSIPVLSYLHSIPVTV